MKRILIVKVTSLGDIVEALPVIADIKRAFPGVQVDWAADEAFAEVVQWSQRVDRILFAPLRRFKKTRRWSDLKAIAASIGELRAYRYDCIIDIQGVYKTAIIAFLARSSRRVGYRNQDLGELGRRIRLYGAVWPSPGCQCLGRDAHQRRRGAGLPARRAACLRSEAARDGRPSPSRRGTRPSQRCSMPPPRTTRNGR